MRNNADLHQGGNLGSNKKWSGSKEMRGFVYVVYEKGKESRINPRFVA